LSANKKIILILPECLLERTDEAADALHMSRLAFIRQAIVARLQTFQNVERKVLETVLGSAGGGGVSFVMDGAVWRRDSE
jgi:metal-responsive CopG/Arc/MetJ family transcriptional regulator